jgi:hypothetical protein
MSEHQLGNAHESSLLSQNTESFNPKALSNENSLSRFASCNRFKIKYLSKGKLRMLLCVIRVFRMAYHFHLNTARGVFFISFPKPQSSIHQGGYTLQDCLTIVTCMPVFNLNQCLYQILFNLHEIEVLYFYYYNLFVSSHFQYHLSGHQGSSLLAFLTPRIQSESHRTGESRQ